MILQAPSDEEEVTWHNYATDAMKKMGESKLISKTGITYSYSSPILGIYPVKVLNSSAGDLCSPTTVYLNLIANWS